MKNLTQKYCIKCGNDLGETKIFCQDCQSKVDHSKLFKIKVNKNQSKKSIENFVRKLKFK